ncbi:MAG: hypothetical protein MI923_24210 [Phycisphaerales bacterium]|nr:hypothetical protein [Phycisphaerales bacterium]
MMNSETKHAGWLAVQFAEPPIGSADWVARPANGLIRAASHDHRKNDESRHTLIAAIAHELSMLRGGMLTRHVPEARRLLEQVFDRIEQSKKTWTVA